MRRHRGGHDSDNDNDGYSDAEKAPTVPTPGCNSVSPHRQPVPLQPEHPPNLSAGAVVGKLSDDPDGNASLSFARTPGPGSRDNALFFVGPQNLQALSSLDFETNSTLASGSGSATTETPASPGPSFFPSSMIRRTTRPSV